MAAGFALTFVLGPWGDECVTDIPLYSSYAQTFLDGRCPTATCRSSTRRWRRRCSRVGGAGGGTRTHTGWRSPSWRSRWRCDGAALRRVGGRAPAATAARALLAAAAAPLLCGAMLRTHFDLVPVVLTLAALALLCADRPRAGLAVLGVAVAMKLFPLVVAPVVLAWLVARGQRRAAAEGTAALAIVVVVAYGAAAALSVDGTVDSLTYHLDRPVQVESSPAVVVRGTRLARSRHRACRATASAPTGSTMPRADVGDGALRGAARGRGGPAGARARRERRTSAALVLASLAATVAFACLGKVLSPQFLIWVVPLMRAGAGLADARPGRAGRAGRGR